MLTLAIPETRGGNLYGHWTVQTSMAREVGSLSDRVGAWG